MTSGQKGEKNSNKLQFLHNYLKVNIENNVHSKVVENKEGVLRIQKYNTIYETSPNFALVLGECVHM